MDLEEGQTVRLYEQRSDHYTEGTVTKVEKNYVEVDFDDWIERFPRNAFVIYNSFGNEVPSTAKRGIKIDEFNPTLLGSRP